MDPYTAAVLKVLFIWMLLMLLMLLLELLSSVVECTVVAGDDVALVVIAVGAFNARAVTASFIAMLFMWMMLLRPLVLMLLS